MKLIVILTLIAAAGATLTCSDLTSVWEGSSCCDDPSTTTCLRAIPDCASTDAGKVCWDGNDVVVKGLLDRLAFDSTIGGGQPVLTLKSHIIPDTNAAYDFGNAALKIRDIYEDGN